MLFIMDKCVNMLVILAWILVSSVCVNCTEISTNESNTLYKSDKLYRRYVSINDTFSKNTTTDSETSNAEITKIDGNETISLLTLFNESIIEYEEPIALPILHIAYPRYPNDRIKRSRSSSKRRHCKTSPFYKQELRHLAGPVDTSQPTKKRRRPPPPMTDC